MVAWWTYRRNQFADFLSPGAGTQIRLRMRLPVVLALVLLALTLLTPDRIWTTLLVSLGGLLLIAYVWTRLLASGLSGTRQMQYGWISVGDRLQEQFTLTNRSAVPALWVEVADDSTVPGYHAAIVQSVASHDTVSWRQSAVCERRGQYHLGPWSLRSGDPFGLFEVIHLYGATDEIIIHPQILSHLPIPLPPGQSEGRARTVTRAWQATINAAGVRGYQPNDPYHWIHWKTSARRDEMYVRQFERDAAGDIWLVVDCDAAVQLGTGAEGTEEQSVLLAASLAARATLDRRPVGLAAYGPHPQVVPPALGQGQEWAILRALALMTADGATSLNRALRDLGEIAGRGSAAIIITSSDSPDWLPALLNLEQNGVESHVLLLDRASYAGIEAPSQSEGLWRAIVEAGFRCELLQQESIARPPEPEERHGFWEFKVTGMGKAIAVRRPAD